ncbi:multi protein bridging factor 1-domain-containing protein [Boletus edulis]|uniref:YlMBF1 n=1 Tax=Boletus edulis BED1 TaxID=1328754 RepID=A0AAD4BJH3_BOLED|nr:multi protein bridging factor 1-domain-containing protein [Boletus edulis]KAF8431792.1 ylMBF1 [Boletus edulis BED1]
MSGNLEWDSKTVIGHKAKAPKVARNAAELNAVSRLARRSGAVVAIDKKVTAGGNKAHAGPDHQKIAKLDRENEVAPPPKVNPSVGKAIQSARMEKQLTQKDLAQKINEKPSVIQDYESGKAIPSLQILSKMERVLAVKLRGSDIGKKLEGPKKS